MTDQSPRAVVLSWLATVGCHANSLLGLVEYDDGRAAIRAEEAPSDPVTACADWSVELTAPSLAALAALCAADLAAVGSSRPMP